MGSATAPAPVLTGPLERPKARVRVAEADTVDRADPLVGEVVDGRYRVLWPVARGGMARVYEVEHIGVGRRLAMKVMHPHLAERPALVARFEREARAAARARSAYSVDVVDLVHLAEGRAAIVSEWLDGEDLEARLARDERVPLDEALAIAADVCRGLAAAHRAGVVHRDLKPANVFLVDPAAGGARAKILDFGVAKLAGAPDAHGDESPLTHAGSILGTPAYMAPEQARGADEVDARADVYGVGALLYRMRTGIPPHPPGDPAATLKRVLRDEPRRPTDLDPAMPSAVEALIQRAMARDRALRYPDVGALLEAIEALRGDASARPGAPVERAVDDGERPGRGAAVVASVGLALGATYAVALGVRGELEAALAGSELRLLRGLAAVAGVAVSFLLLRGVARAWPSGPAVAALRRAIVQALVAGASVFGALELHAAGGLALDGAMVAPGVAGRALLAAALAVACFALRRPRAT